MQIMVRYNTRDMPRKAERCKEEMGDREGEAWMQTKLVCEKIKMLSCEKRGQVEIKSLGCVKRSVFCTEGR